MFFFHHFLPSSIFYVKRTYWNSEKFRLPVFNRFICVGKFWTWFHYFNKMSVSLCMWHGHSSAITHRRKCTHSCISLHLSLYWCCLDFGEYRSRCSAVRNFRFTLHTGVEQNWGQLNTIVKTFIYCCSSKV